jgi:hypothetical protein
MGRYYENEYLENTSGYALGYGPVAGSINTIVNK